MAKIQIFWDTGEGERYKSWSTMYRNDDIVTFWYRDFDQEDFREYDYIGQFSVDDYRKALEELQKTGSVQLTEPRGTLTMTINDDSVNIGFCGSPSPSSTPGGAMLSGSVESSCKLKALMLKD